MEKLDHFIYQVKLLLFLDEHKSIKNPEKFIDLIENTEEIKTKLSMLTGSQKLVLMNEMEELINSKINEIISLQDTLKKIETKYKNI